jgi:hypothetical protein
MASAPEAAAARPRSSSVCVAAAGAVSLTAALTARETKRLSFAEIDPHERS